MPAAEHPVFALVAGELWEQTQEFARRGHEENASTI